MCHNKDKLDEMGVRVLIISFSAPPFVRAWLEETGVPFPVLLDENLSVYRSYGLKRSAARTFSPKTLWYYFRRRSDRIKHANADDIYQLGGDFIVDGDGILRFVYPSREPVDRPPINQLLPIFAAIKNRAGDGPG